MPSHGLEGTRDSIPTFKSLEKSAALDETYELACEVSGDPYFDSSLSGHLAERYGVSDRESFDCHSFMASIAKHELGAAVVTAPEFAKPDRNKSQLESDWQQELQKEIATMFQSPEGKSYVVSQRTLTKAIFDNSERLRIPYIQAKTEKDSQMRTSVSRHITNQVIGEITRKAASRVLLFTTVDEGEFREVHSSIILGISKDGSDVLLLEKFQIGDPIHIRRLSDIIEMQTLPYTENLTLNILRQPITRIAQ